VYLKQIKRIFSGITTFELMLPLRTHFPLAGVNFFFEKSIGTATLDAVDRYIRAFSSVKDIIINIQLGEGVTLSDDLRQMMLDRHWVVKIRCDRVRTNIAQFWIVNIISSDDRFNIQMINLCQNSILKSQTASKAVPMLTQ
jgi:hypothetical protein